MRYLKYPIIIIMTMVVIPTSMKNIMIIHLVMMIVLIKEINQNMILMN